MWADAVCIYDARDTASAEAKAESSRNRNYCMKTVLCPALKVR